MDFIKANVNPLINLPCCVDTSYLFCSSHFYLAEIVYIGFNSFPLKLSRSDSSVFCLYKIVLILCVIFLMVMISAKFIFESTFKGLNFAMNTWFFCHFY